MAWIWNRILPKAMRAETTPSARIDDYVAGKIQPDGPGLALAVVKAGSVVHAAIAVSSLAAGVLLGFPNGLQSLVRFAALIQCGKHQIGLH